MSLNITLLQLLNSFSHFSLLLFQHLLNFPFHIPIHLTFFGYSSRSGISNSSSNGTYHFRWMTVLFRSFISPWLVQLWYKTGCYPFPPNSWVWYFVKFFSDDSWNNSNNFVLCYKQWHSFGSDILDILNISLLEKLFNVLFYKIFKWIEYVK